MLIRYSGGVYTDLIRFHAPFLLIAYFDEQMIHHHTLEISPTFCDVCPSDKVRIIAEDIIPSLNVIETLQSESFDFAVSLGLDYGNYYDYNNEHPLPLMIAVDKNGKVIDTSYQKCFCLETMLELIAEIDIDLLKPPGVGES